MTLNEEIAGSVYFPGPRVVVTSTHVDTEHSRYLVRDLRGIERVGGYAYPVRATALVCGVIELVSAVPLAVFYGLVVLAGTGLLTAASMAVAVWADGRHNQRWMVLRAHYRGHLVPLFRSRDKREFEQVCRAVQRAVEVNRLPH